MTSRRRPRLDIDVIVHTAGQLADEHGWEEVTLARLAQALGIRSPSLYNHVNGLPELRNRLAIYALQLMDRRLRLAMAGRTGEAALRAVAHAYLNFAREHPGMYEATLRAADPAQTEHTRIADQMVQMFIDIFTEEGFRGTDVIHAVRGLRSMLHGFASLEKRGGFAMPVNIDETFDRMIDIYLSGIRASQSSNK